jgi:manganese/iron transport system permease protein
MKADIGDALAHTTLPGVALAYLGRFSLSLGATAAAITTAVLISCVSRRRRIQEDTAIGIIFTGMFALGIVILSRTKTSRNLTDVLLGNVLAVTPGDVGFMAIATLVVAIVLFAIHKELELASYDHLYGMTVGLDPDRLRFILLVLLAITVVTAIQVVGLILTTALLVTPAATASLVSRTLPQMLVTSITLAVSSAGIGLLISYHFRVPSGATIVLSAVSIFVLISILGMIPRQLSFRRSLPIRR